MNDLVEAARQYLGAGLSVISLTGKAPNSFFHPEGLNTPLKGIPENEDDNQLIHRVFTHPTTSGIGIPIPLYVAVVDIDGPEGARAWRELVGDDYEADTPVARTGRGLHLWFMTDRILRSTVLGPKLDLKGVGGYVAAPPSRHPQGGMYAWLDPLVDEMSGQRIRMDWLPDEIDAVCVEKDVVLDYEPPWVIIDGKITRKELDLEELKARIINAADGDQNNQIARAALIARDEGVPFETAMKELLQAAEVGKHPRRRAEITIRGAYRRAKRA